MAKPNVKGTYQLVRRELPDGKVQLPPQLKGILTITKNVRNFSVVWQDSNGNYYSECYVAHYKLTPKKYKETQEYLIINDQIKGTGISYDLSPATATSPVTVEDGRIRFALPQPFEKNLAIEVEFEGPNMKAMSKDLFIDYWEKFS